MGRKKNSKDKECLEYKISYIFFYALQQLMFSNDYKFYICIQLQNTKGFKQKAGSCTLVKSKLVVLIKVVKIEILCRIVKGR